MKHLIITLRMYLPLILVFLFLNACQEKKPEETNQAAAIGAAGIPLDILSIPIKEFKMIPNGRNVILKPYMENGRITLRGWTYVNANGQNPFNKVVYLNLKKDSETTLVFEDDTYMGSQTLTRPQIQNIITGLTNPNITGDLLFTPEIYTDPIDNERHIIYRIKPKTPFADGAKKFEEYSNPSPPRKMTEQ